MENYCAKIENGLVTQVIVCGDEAWANASLGGEWVCSGAQLVGIGWTYSQANGFRSPQPYASWTWADGEWTPPVPQPEGFYVWDEDEQEWVEVQ